MDHWTEMYPILLDCVKNCLFGSDQMVCFKASGTLDIMKLSLTTCMMTMMMEFYRIHFLVTLFSTIGTWRLFSDRYDDSSTDPHCKQQHTLHAMKWSFFI